MINKTPAEPESDTPSTTGTDPELTRPASGGLTGLSPGKLAWRRFRRDRSGVISGFVVLFFLVIALAAPLVKMVYGKDAYTLYGQHDGLLNAYGYPIKPNGGMSADHWFGIEPSVGRDVFMQLIYGMRTSIYLSIAITAVCMITAIILGLLAGYLGGWVDYLVMRVADLLMAFPQQLFFIAFIPVVGALFIDPRDTMPTWFRICMLILVLWILGWMGVARILRSTVLSMREREFIEAARVSGASTWRIVRKELLPNLTTPIIVQATLMLPMMVTTEAGLSYLGVGMVEPTPDWGRMFATGATVYQSDLTYMIFPTIAMIIFIVAFNLFGDSVRDALDPKAAR